MRQRTLNWPANPYTADIVARPTTHLNSQLVVIGSSAGGIEALSRLVASLPADFAAPVVIAQLYAAIPAITAAGTTVLLVEQNIEQALAASSRVCCLLEGRIVLTGRPGDLSRDAIVSAYFGI